jgi:hypothetical protein
MNIDTMLTAALATSLRQATILRCEGRDSVIVDGDAGDELVCEVLDTGANPPLQLAPRDTVLVWRPDPHTPRGVLLGRVGLSHAEPAEEVVIEAGHSLVLRVGDGSITIREDGRILIKGKDLVSHAQRMNRIKGGAVSIN